ncbi:YebC/PmpR family DNA-binding transcriptional regulator [bacterium]|nr:YebC/PmpR family DNA-binding transcriptional regulator [bacterium]MCP5461844.1 YebC/PmpR family DNA-binding transcriptional regulator [bacterium]
MSGHSKWSSIKHKKAAADAKRGKIFSRFSKEITVAAKIGGGDPDMNPRLRTAISMAKDNNMPNDTIDKAIKKGTGELPGVTYEECVYEGYGPSGVAILVEAMTDNRNRTTAEIRNIFSKRNGNLAAINAVAWMFEKKGLIVINRDKVDEEKLLSVALEAGADDVLLEEEKLKTYEVVTTPANFGPVKDALDANKIPQESAEIISIPNSTVPLTDKTAKPVYDLIMILEDHDDVQNVYSNADFPEEFIEEMENEE